MKIFVSYSRTDAGDFARQISEHLRGEHDVFTDKDSIQPGSVWSNVIENNISNCDLFVPIITHRALRSSHVEKEILQALSENKTIIPCFHRYVSKNQIKWNLAQLQGIEFEDRYELTRAMTQNIYLFEKMSNQTNRTKRNTQASQLYQGGRPSIAAQTTRSNVIRKPSIFRGEKPRTFVGRANDIEKIKECFKKPGARVTIFGLGGTGKSALAFKTIHECEDMFDLIIPIYFASQLTINDFLLRIAESLIDDKEQLNEEFKKEGGADIDRRIEILLNVMGQGKNNNSSRILILADNYESISYILNDTKRSRQDEDDDIVKINEFLNNVPDNVSILVTSRERKNLDGEIVIDLQGLNTEEGRELFVKLANDPHLTHSTHSRNIQEAIDDIAEKTGGHPLSIEILAQSYDGSGLNKIKGMSQTLGVGDVNPRQTEARLNSLKSSFEYSINNMDDNLKNLLYKLTLFNSPFLLSAVKEIFAQDIGYDVNNNDDLTQQNDVLNHLYNRSLLKRIESDEYGELQQQYWLYYFHKALRIYLENSINVILGGHNYNDDDIIENRINNYNKQRLEEDYGENVSSYYSKLSSDVSGESLKGGVEESTLSYIRCINIILEGENNDLERAIKLTKDYEKRIYLSRDIGFILYYQSFYSKAKHYFEEALKFGEKSGDRVNIALDYLNMALAESDLGKNEEAIEYSNKALPIFEELDDRENIAFLYNNLGTYFSNLGDPKKYEEAMRYHEKALNIGEQLKRNDIIADVYGNIAFLHSDLGNFEEAISYNKKALTIYEELGNNNRRLALLYNNMGKFLMDSGDRKKYEEAMEYHKKSLKIAENIMDKYQMAENYGNISTIYSEWDKNEEAMEYSNKALLIYEELGNSSRIAMLYNNIGVILSRLSRNEEAMEYHKKSLKIAEEFGDIQEIGRNYRNMFSLLSDSGKEEEANKAAKKGLEILKEYEQKTGIHSPDIEEFQELIP